MMDEKEEHALHTAGPSPRCNPRMPSFRHVFVNTSKTLLYTRCEAPSSPCNCRPDFL